MTDHQSGKSEERLCIMRVGCCTGAQGSHVIMFAPTPADCCHNHFLPIRMILIRSNTLSSCSCDRSFSPHFRPVAGSALPSSLLLLVEEKCVCVCWIIRFPPDFIASRESEVNWFGYVFLCFSLFLPKEKELPGVSLGLRAWKKGCWSLITFAKSIFETEEIFSVLLSNVQFLFLFQIHLGPKYQSGWLDGGKNTHKKRG